MPIAGADADPTVDGSAPESFLTVTARSSCSAPVIAECPPSHIVVGGGIEFADAYAKCEPTIEGEPIASELFVHGLASYPLDPSEGNGWYCRVDGREVDCYAVCAHREMTGVSSFVRASAYKPGHRECGNSGCPSTVAATCPAGTTVIGGGLQSESLWELEPEPCCSIADAEEYKVLGIFVEGNGIRCNDKSQDHWSTCFALCVATEELERTSVTVAPLAVAAESRCQAGQRLLGGGFSLCPTMDCSARLDRLQARPHGGEDAFLCAARVLPKETAEDPATGVLRTPQCQAICAEIRE